MKTEYHRGSPPQRGLRPVAGIPPSTRDGPSSLVLVQTPRSRPARPASVQGRVSRPLSDRPEGGHGLTQEGQDTCGVEWDSFTREPEGPSES